MPLMNHYHDWQQAINGFKCSMCSAYMTQAQVAAVAPNDNEAAMAGMGDDTSIWQAAWSQTSQTTTGG